MCVLWAQQQQHNSLSHDSVRMGESGCAHILWGPTNKIAVHIVWQVNITWVGMGGSCLIKLLKKVHPLIKSALHHTMLQKNCSSMEVLMRHSDEWVLWLDLTYEKLLLDVREAGVSCWGKEWRGQQIYELILRPHLCWENFGGFFFWLKEFVWFMPVWDIGKGSYQRSLPNVSASEFWTKFVCQETHQCDVASHLSSHYFKILGRTGDGVAPGGDK